MTDDKRNGLLEKIRALLAKAESTEFPEEAYSLQAKAQELMTRYAIEDIELQKLNPGRTDTIVTVFLNVIGPYALAKGDILAAVTRNNRCRLIHPNRLTQIRDENGDIQKGVGTFRIYGFESDVNLVQMAFTSLLIQANTEMLDSELDRITSASTVVHGKTWRNSFLKGYAYGVNERLRKATADATNAANLSAPGTGLVLVDRKKAVDDFISANLRTSKRSTASAISGAGYGAGKAAADRADVGSRRLPNQLRALR